MSLSIEWFAASDQRNKMRDANGVSIEEAEGDLAFNSSSAYPVAEETARWIYKNWSLEKIFQLSPSARQTLLRIIEDQLKIQHKDKPNINARSNRKTQCH